VRPPVDCFPLRIGQVATLLKMAPDALRNWERNGLLAVPRESNGYRAYGPEDIERLRVIRTLRAAGYGMMAILRMLMGTDAGEDVQIRETLDTPDPGQGIWYATDRWLTTLSEQEKRGQDVVALLEELLERAEF
jgi:DNA-binding transcriptional MerR regulator